MGTTRKLTRSYKGVIGGVCGGLGKYFDIDVVLVRVIFVLLFFVGGGGVGLLLYIILWIAVPRETNYFAPFQTENDSGNPNVAQENSKPAAAPSSRNNSAAYIIGMSLIALGCVILLRKLFFIGFAYLFPIGLMVVGMALILAYLFNNKKAEL